MMILPIVDGDRTIGEGLVLNIDEALRPVIFHEAEEHNNFLPQPGGAPSFTV
jgi:hypothetical protein